MFSQTGIFKNFFSRCPSITLPVLRPQSLILLSINGSFTCLKQLKENLTKKMDKSASSSAAASAAQIGRSSISSQTYSAASDSNSSTSSTQVIQSQQRRFNLERTERRISPTRQFVNSIFKRKSTRSSTVKLQKEAASASEAASPSLQKPSLLSKMVNNLKNSEFVRFDDGTSRWTSISTPPPPPVKGLNHN
jgi:DNA polymerase III alpha subunit